MDEGQKENYLWRKDKRRITYGGRIEGELLMEEGQNKNYLEKTLPSFLRLTIRQLKESAATIHLLNSQRDGTIWKKLKNLSKQFEKLNIFSGQYNENECRGRLKTGCIVVFSSFLQSKTPSRTQKKQGKIFSFRLFRLALCTYSRYLRIRICPLLKVCPAFLPC